MTPPAQIRDVRRIAVASIPSGHPYVRGLSFGDDDVTRLPDPVPEGATSPGQWWPPVMLDPRWIRSHVDDLDLVHVHFGVESFPLEHLRAVIATLRETGKPLVYTVHDLVNPQLTDQSAHDEQLGLL
ncbi:MAG: glycosyltransferase family 1 protein, partial [Williamsia herbipolensis]|nr:glycosyltransferase family 1 protein [Williamsia herbipolensis]